MTNTLGANFPHLIGLPDDSKRTVHIFDRAQLDQVIADTIPSLPPNKTGAAVALVDKDGIKVAVEVESTNGHWKATGAYEHDWNGDNSIGGKVMYSW
jgi:hypothetical protein